MFEHDDVKRAADYLGLTEQVFCDAFKVLRPGYIDITGGCCPLLNLNNTCMIQEAKPKLCAGKNPCEEKNAKS